MIILRSFCASIVLAILIQLFACKNTYQEPSVVSTIIIDADNIPELVDLKLTDIAENFKIIPLETTNGCLLDNHTEYYVNDRYILAYSENGVYKFSTEGKFIKKLFGLGRGPNEFFALVGFCNFVVDDKSDKLYIEDQFRRKEFLVYDLKSESFLKPIKKYLPNSGSFAIFNDSLIICSNHSYTDSSNYAVYFQNFYGDLTFGVTHNKKVLYNRTETVQPSWLSRCDTNFFVSFIRDDTLFRLKGNKLDPFLALKFNIPRNNLQSVTTQKGDRVINFQSFGPSNFIISIRITEDILSISSESRLEKNRTTFLLFDKTTGKTSKINSYADNLIGKTQDVLKMSQTVGGGNIDLPTIFSNSKLLVAYYPRQIKDAIKEGLNYKDFQDSINNQLIHLQNRLQETDNPVLLIGTVK
jgi:hypothetical protein